jgi:hypothetical protein
MPDDRISQGWDLIFEGLPYYNVVKLTEGYRSLFSVIYESTQRKEIDKLNNICKQIDENVEKIRGKVKNGEYESETEMLSCNIMSSDLEALSRITKAIVKKLSK